MLLDLGSGLHVDDGEGDAVVRVEVISNSQVEPRHCSTSQQEELVMTDTPALIILSTAGEEAAVLRPHQLDEAPGQHRGLHAELGHTAGNGWLEASAQ